MTGDNKHIDKLFRDSLKGLREKPPVHAWNRLDKSLDASVFRKKLFYFRLAAASILILMAFGAGYFYALYLNQPQDVVEQEIPLQAFPETLTDTDPLDQKTDTPPESVTHSADKTRQVLAESEQEPVIRNTQNDGIPAEYLAVAVTPTTKEESIVQSQNTEIQIPSNSSTGLSGMVYLDITRLNYQDSNIDAAQNLFAKHQPVNLFSVYDDMVPYDFDLAKDKKNYKWAVGAQFAPTYSYRDISSNYGVNPGGNPDQQDNYNNIEDGLNSYAGGLNVDYNFSGNWSFQSGVYFSRIGQVNNDALKFQQFNNEVLLSAINTSTGNVDVAIERVPDNVKKISPKKDSIDMSSVQDVKVIQNFDLFEIPFLIKYKVLNRKFSIQFSGGLSPAYLVDNNTYLEMENRKYDVGSSGNLNDMIVNTSLGLGLEYLVTKQLSINFEPTFKYALNPINNNSNFSYHPYYFSWFTGIRLKIN